MNFWEFSNEWGTCKRNICLGKELFTKFYPRILVNQTWLVLLWPTGSWNLWLISLDYNLSWVIFIVKNIYQQNMNLYGSSWLCQGFFANLAKYQTLAKIVKSLFTKSTYWSEAAAKFQVPSWHLHTQS